MTLRTADACDADDRLVPLCLPWRSFGGVTAFSGPMSTVRCRDDNGLVRAAVSEAGDGRVLLVDGGGSLQTALVGDVLGGLAVEHGWAGIVVVGAVRDVVALRDLPLGVLALGTVPRRGARTGQGERDVPVVVAGVTCRPGAVLLADEDGVLTMGDSSVAV
jgi:regulator of ribonuclease activity A